MAVFHAPPPPPHRTRLCAPPGDGPRPGGVPDRERRVSWRGVAWRERCERLRVGRVIVPSSVHLHTVLVHAPPRATTPPRARRPRSRTKRDVASRERCVVGRVPCAAPSPYRTCSCPPGPGRSPLLAASPTANKACRGVVNASRAYISLH